MFRYASQGIYFGFMACPPAFTPVRIVLRNLVNDQRDNGPFAVRFVPDGAPGSGPCPPLRSRP